MDYKQNIELIYNLVLSRKIKLSFEKMIIYLALLGFLLHLILILVFDIKNYISDSYDAYINAISAIYTPFSIILFYEIYLLIYYLRKSFVVYIGKQYEVIALILIRSIFNDLSQISEADTTFIYRMGGVAILYLLIFLFYLISSANSSKENTVSEHIPTFRIMKKGLSLLLFATFLGLLIYSGVRWFINFTFISGPAHILKEVNNMFYSDFFMVLILVEVIFLLLTLRVSDRFSTVIRNSGFIISTTLLKLSFAMSGMQNLVMVILAVTFGIVVSGIYLLYTKIGQ